VYQKGKTSLDFAEPRVSEWQWHQLGHMQVCTSLQTDNHDSTPPLSLTPSISQTCSLLLFGLIRGRPHVSASLLCNSLPADIQSSPSLPVFRQRLKTFLFHSSVTLLHLRGLCSNSAILATLKFFDIDSIFFLIFFCHTIHVSLLCLGVKGGQH